jgi:lipoate-protein ligase B
MQFWSLKGLISYEAAQELQLKLVELRHRELIPDTILFLEHEPVITRGRGLQFTGTPRPRHMPAPQILPPGVAFSESERGGDLTYHGPGQWVVYPICKLDGKGFAPHHDIAGFLRKLERSLIDLLSARGLSASTQENATGVWISERKIASIGIAVRKWVTFHGIALNCVVDLKPFYLISPCGFNPEVMTRLADWIELDSNWRTEIESEFAKMLSAHTVQNEIQSLTLQQVQAICESYLVHLRDAAVLCES